MLTVHNHLGDNVKKGLPRMSGTARQPAIVATWSFGA